jgi:hypothetical protein
MVFSFRLFTGSPLRGGIKSKHTCINKISAGGVKT